VLSLHYQKGEATKMIKIDKRLARKVFEAGKDIIAIPHKMNPNNQFFSMGAVF
jgi:hypothetical protein